MKTFVLQKPHWRQVVIVGLIPAVPGAALGAEPTQVNETAIKIGIGLHVEYPKHIDGTLTIEGIPKPEADLLFLPAPGASN